ncbi:hypothetical protein BT93_L1052 [Corymbia citriodora subsp. variegata]|uniref:DUF4220 domain-containing protein n=1 Tax=Corymbia citriodora subsp. variegata TaxID=360336 RepID=A0A8T0CTH0_CORYI|nr:hypothetical protein BT93_L1052 [Corymbia citriodora subsp. variegata]
MRNLMEMNQRMAPAPAPATTADLTYVNLLKLLQIELLVILTAFLLLFLVIFGSWRRRCNNGKFRLIIFTAYTLSTYVLTYTLGLMHHAPLRTELFPVWAMFLMMTFGSADSISAYSLEDNEQWKRYNWHLSIKMIWLVLLIGLYIRDSSNTGIAIKCLFFVLFLKSDERARALMAASRQSLQRNSKVIADHMSREHESGEVDPVRMTGYTYVVRGEEKRWVDGFVRPMRFIKSCLGKKEKPAPDYRMTLEKEKDRLITIEKVWKCEGRLLQGGDPHNKLKDICLSFALFKLLRLRYAGYSLPQEAHKKTWNLILHGLLAQEDSYKRAFRVIEVELTFLFDFFYTKYGIIFHPGRLMLKMMEFITVIMGIWATISLLKHRRENVHGLAYFVLGVENRVTSVMIILFIIVELLQFFFMGFSEWAKVIWICKYVEKKSWQKNECIERMIRAICGVRLLKPWERKLRQYSFIKSYSYKPSRLLNNEFTAAYINQTRNGQRQSKPIKLPEEVKHAVFHALKWKYSTKLENGEASLRLNKVSDKLLWACQLETQTQVIMVWHIASSFCEHQKPIRSGSPGWKNFLVATSLSQYLSYLVAFAPRLLPDHPYVAEYVFNQAIIEARDFFGRCKKLKNRVMKIKSQGNGNSANEKTIIKQGARLGNQLVNDIKDIETTWKILADFWVELVLYVAPSDNAKAHAEHLARGGEFVTHLWALLFHVGIERDPPAKPRNALKRSNSF